MKKIIGLTNEEVEIRKKRNQVNFDNQPKTKTIKEIILTNIFTYFNILNFILGAAILIVGIFSGRIFYSLKNCLFLGVITCNTVIAVIQEIISKKTVDKLSLISATTTTVLRDDKLINLNINEIVLDDIIKLKLGDQIVADAKIISGEIEVNESLLTGESDAIIKKTDNEVLSGSFVVSGEAYAKVIHVGNDNYISKISAAAKYNKKINSVILDSFNKILKAISIIIIPIAILLFITQLKVNNNEISTSIFSTVAALIGMIPEGLILLTSSVMAVSVIKLSKFKVLVQELYCIETLARVDCICLDKTGTLTEGKMKLKKVIVKKTDEKNIREIINAITENSNETNETFMAIKRVYNDESSLNVIESKPFSSERKYSVYTLNDGYTYYLGAPEFILSKNHKLDDDIIKYQEEYRVLLLARNKERIGNKNNVEIIGFIVIEDIIRENALQTLQFFAKNKVNIKIISGDNINTVMGIAKRLEIPNLKGIDTSNIIDSNYDKLVDEYNVFGRVTPKVKKQIIISLQNKGYTVAMTGDGVNDVLALKQSDCAIAMANGSSAARNVSQLVLLNSNFNSIPKIVAEGRKTINNVERSSSLLLVKTIYSILLAIFCISITTKYFFVPIQLTLITTFTIGIPSFILALEPNKKLVTGDFIKKVVGRAFPAAVTIVFNIIIITIFKKFFSMTTDIASLLSVLLTATTGFIYLYRICKPFNRLRKVLYIVLLLGFSYCALFQYKFFSLTKVNFYVIFIYFVLFIVSMFVFDNLNKFTEFILKILIKRNKQKR